MEKDNNLYSDIPDATLQDPIKNYRSFCQILSLISYYFEINGYNLTSEKVDYIQKILPLEKGMRLGSDATIEIERLLLQNNNNSERLISKIYSDCIDFENCLDLIADNNLIIKRSLALRGQKLAEYIDDLKGLDVKIFNTHAYIQSIFYFIFEGLVKLSGKNKKTPIPINYKILFPGSEAERGDNNELTINFIPFASYFTEGVFEKILKGLERENIILKEETDYKWQLKSNDLEGFLNFLIENKKLNCSKVSDTLRKSSLIFFNIFKENYKGQLNGMRQAKQRSKQLKSSFSRALE